MIWRFPWCCSVEPARANERVDKAPLPSSSADRRTAQGRSSHAGPVPDTSGASAAVATANSRKGSPEAKVGGTAGGGSVDNPLPVVEVIPSQGGQPTKGGKGGARGGESATTIEQEADDTMSVASSHVSGRSIRSSTSTVASEYINECIGSTRLQEAAKIQQAMKSFVRSMVRGQQMGVISPDGALRTCNCSLDKKLKKFKLQLKGSVREIPLADMSEVFQGTEPEDIKTPLDELCATIMLESQECISFHFNDVPAREHFATCLQILVDGHH